MSFSRALATTGKIHFGGMLITAPFALYEYNNTAIVRKGNLKYIGPITVAGCATLWPVYWGFRMIPSSTYEEITEEQCTGEQYTGEQCTGEQCTGEQCTGEQCTGEQTTEEQVEEIVEKLLND